MNAPLRRAVLVGLLSAGAALVAAPVRADDPPTPPGGGDKPAGEKPPESKPGDAPGGDKPAGDAPGGDKPSGDKPAGEKPADGAAPAPATPAPPPLPADPLKAAIRLVRNGRAAEARPYIEKAIADGHAEPEAFTLWQDLCGEGPDAPKLLDFFRRRATEKPDDAYAQFLAARLMPPKESLPEFERLAQKFAQSPWPLAGRARAMERMGRISEALKAYESAIVLAPDEMRLRAGRALVLETAGRWADARDEWKRVTDAKPDDFAARVGLGEAFRRTQEFDAALTQFDAAAQADPTDPEPAYRSGLTQADQKKWDEAIVAFDRALVLEPKLIEALCAASQTVLKKVEAAAREAKKVVVVADLEAAVKYADRAVEAAPDRPEPYVTRGAVHEVAGDADAARWDAALADYAAALDRLPGNSPAAVRIMLARAHVLLLTERYDDAVALAARATDADPKSESAWGALGEILSAAGKDDDAIKRAWKPGIRALPESARLRHGHGLSLWRTDKLSDALKEFKEATQLAPNEGRYKLSFGECLYQASKEKESLPELLAATGLLPEDPVAWSCYGHALVSNQKWKEAAEAYEKSCGYNDKAVDEHLALAVIYADRLKDRELARSHARTWRERGGTQPVLDGWIEALLK